MDKGYIVITQEALQDLQHLRDMHGDIKKVDFLEVLLMLKEHNVKVESAVATVEGLVRLEVSGDLPDSETGQVALNYGFSVPSDGKRELTLEIVPPRKPEPEQPAADAEPDAPPPTAE